MFKLIDSGSSRTLGSIQLVMRDEDDNFYGIGAMTSLNKSASIKIKIPGKNDLLSLIELPNFERCERDSVVYGLPFFDKWGGLNPATSCSFRVNLGEDELSGLDIISDFNSDEWVDGTEVFYRNESIGQLVGKDKVTSFHFNDEHHAVQGISKVKLHSDKNVDVGCLVYDENNAGGIVVGRATETIYVVTVSKIIENTDLFITNGKFDNEVPLPFAKEEFEIKYKFYEAFVKYQDINDYSAFSDLSLTTDVKIEQNKLDVIEMFDQHLNGGANVASEFVFEALLQYDWKY